MASGNDREPMDVTYSEGNLYDQSSDRKKFKPLRAIRRMFRGKKKSKEFSKSTGSIFTAVNAQDSFRPSSSIVRSVSHESVFAPEGTIHGPEDGSLRHALSADNVNRVTVPINRLKDTDELDAAKSMSIGSDVTKSTNDLKKDAPEINIDLDMNDLPVTVPRLNNKAAYDKIALRPKRRAAARSRGAQQKHVIRVEAQINGFPDASTLEDEKEEISRDISPPVAKKPRPPSFLVPPPDADRGAGGSSITPKRHSMLGRSPTGPGMIVPTLEDMQKVKLRKRQPDSESKTNEKPTIEIKQDKSVSVSEKSKADKTKPFKRSNSDKKSPKPDRKNQSEGGSSFFPWKNKSTSTSKSPPISPKPSEDPQKENEKPKLSPKPVKKNINAKESKVISASKLFSGNDKKETTKKKPFGLGKKDKNHSGNNSKPKGESAASENPVKMDISSSEKETDVKNTEDTKNENVADSDAGQEKSPEIIEEKPDSKPDTKSKYAEMLKLEAAKLAEKRVDSDQEKEKPTSPKSPLDDKKMIFGEPMKLKTAEPKEVPKPEKPSSPKSPLEDKKPIFGEVIKLKSPDHTKNTTTIINSNKADKSKDETDITTVSLSAEKKEQPEVISPVRKVFSPISTQGDVASKSILKPSKSNEKSEAMEDSKQADEGTKTLNDKDDISAKTLPSTKTEESKSQISDKITLTTTKKSSPVFPRARTSEPKQEAFEAAKSIFGERKARANTEPSTDERKEVAKNANERGVTFSPRTRTKTPTDEEAGGLYSRNKLKPIGDKSGQEKFGEKKSESFRTTSVTSPTRALRTRSFNVGSNSPVHARILAEQTKEDSTDKKERTSSLRTRSPTKEKPIIAAKPAKTPELSPTKTSKTLIQDVENNNVKPTENKTEESKTSDKPSGTHESTKPVLRRNTTKSRASKDGDNKNNDGVPSWIQVAKRRSKVWEDGQIKKEIKPADDSSSEKEVDRPRSLTVGSKVSANKPESTEDGPKPTPKERKTPFEKAKTTSNAPKEQSTLKDRTTPTPTSTKPTVVTRERVGSLKSPNPPSPTSEQTNRTAPIPNISMVSPKHVITSSKDIDSPGQPSWLAIAMRKQKTWAKEETV